MRVFGIGKRLGTSACLRNALSGHLVGRSECPAQAAPAIAVKKWIVDQDAGPLEIKLENQLSYTFLTESFPDSLLAVFLTVQQQKSPAAGTGDLPA